MAAASRDSSRASRTGWARCGGRRLATGWSPKYIPPALLKEASGRLSHKFLFGSDYPFIPPDRWLADFDKLDGWSDEARERVLWRNGQRLLAHAAAANVAFGAGRGEAHRA